jgi:MFS family permease
MVAQATIRKYYLLLILQRAGVGMTAAVYATFLLSNGLNLLEINLVNMIFFTTLFICEIPTGAFADVFGRKMSFVTSCVIFTTSFMVYASSSSFWEFALAEVLAAIAYTFMSGAFDAWLVDKLRHHGDERALAPVFARGAQLGAGAGLLAALAGAMLFDISNSLPYLVGGAFFAVAGVTAFLTMKEEYFVRESFSIAKGVTAFKNTVRASIQYGLRNPNVRFIMLLVLALNFCTMAPNMQWQPFFREWLPNQTSLGFLWTTMALSLMLGAWLAPKLLRGVASERRALLLCQAGAAVGIVGTVAFGVFPPAVALFLAHEVARGVFGPIKTAYLHDNIPSKERATIVSFESVSHHIGGAAGLLMSGLIAHYASIPWAWTVSGGVLLLVVMLLWKSGK